jgi:glycosyltransferase involved in cell wall biosynthesis
MIFIERQIDSLLAAGVAGRTFHLESRTSPVAILSELRRLRGEIRSFRPQIVHAQYGTATAFLCVLATRLPLIVTFRGSDLNPNQAKGPVHCFVSRLLSQLAALRADRILCVSEQLVRRLWWDRQKAQIVPSGIDTETFRPGSRDAARAALGWDPRERTVLFNGSLRALKRPDLARAAVAAAGRKCGGPVRLVELDGNQSPELVPVMMNAADCLILTSDYEGSPNVVKEAIASGLPVVSRDVGDVRQRLANVQPSKVTGDNAEELGEALAEILGHPLAGRPARSNGPLAAAEFSMTAIAATIVAVYEALAQPGAPGLTAAEVPARRDPGAPVPLVTVIVPCRNEASWIGPCLDSIVGNDYPQDRLEVLVVDGLSNDGTRDVVESFAARCPQLRLVSNEKKITPAALNLGIEAARGSIIVRMDAHVEYPRDYVSSLIALLEKSGADNVGGICQTLPANDSAIARAVAVGMSHPLGVGNSHFRIGAAGDRWVDTVPFGCYRREVFDRIGRFDEDLVRNQDDELNLRLIKHGGRILLSPRIVCKYYARDSLPKLWRMYYQYGYFKPLVVRKLGGVMTVRQLLPPLLVLGLIVTAMAALWSRLAVLAFLAVAGSYLLAVGAAAAAAFRRIGWAAVALLLVFPALHFSYGFGYLRGALEFLVLRRGRGGAAGTVPISR